MDKRLVILQHALGTDDYGRGRQDRNHFVTGAGGSDHALCMEAVADGLMTQHKGGMLTGGDDIFVVTPAGKAYVREHSPKPPKRSPAQKRYQAFLDEDSSLSFGEWLKRGGGRACNA